MSDIEVKRVPAKNGGYLIPQQPGQPTHANVGRKANPFKKHIEELAESGTEIILKGRVLDDNNEPTGETVKVSVQMPGALGVVVKAYKLAAKGDGNARKWLSETGFGKTLNLGVDPDSPLEGGFVIMLPSNDRQ